MCRSFAVMSVAVLVCLVPAAPRAQAPATAGPGGVDPRLLRRAALAQHRPVPRRPHQGGDRRAVQSRTRSTSACPTAACGRPTDSGRIVDADLRRPADRLDRRHRGRAVRSATSSTSAAARACSVPTSPPATASTSPPTRGRTWTHLRPARRAADPADRRRSGRIPTACSSPCSAIPTGPTRSAACSARPTAGATFQKVLSGTRTPAPSTSRIDPDEPGHSSTPRCGRRGRGRGRTATFAAPAAALFKSTDGGTTWRPLTTGLPTWEPTASGRIGVTVAPTRAPRLFAVVEARDGAGHLPLRRRRRELGARQRRPARRGAAVGLRRGEGRIPRNPDIVLRADDRGVEVHRRRQAPSRRSAARRAATTTTDLDQPRRRPT